MKPVLDRSFRPIEEHIRRAQIERAVAQAEALATPFVTIGHAFTWAAAGLGRLWSAAAARRRPTAPRSLPSS